MKEKIKELNNLQPEQIAKYYFPEFSVTTRKSFIKNISFIDINHVNEHLYSLYSKMEKDKKEHMPILLNSIAVNSLGYELNERLEKTIYMDYANKNISKHGKLFVKGQYSIFRNENEQLLLTDEGNTSDKIDKLEHVIELMVELGVLGLINFKEHLEAIKKDPKSIEGIVKKVLKQK